MANRLRTGKGLAGAGAFLFVSLCNQSVAETVAAAPMSSFFADATIDKNLYYFHRDRDRYSPETQGYETNLGHGTMQANFSFSSGYYDGWIGLDLAVFGAADLFFDKDGAPDHEFSFFADQFGGWYQDSCVTKNPGAGSKKCKPETGLSLSTAAIKMKFMDDALKFKAGYIQANVPGIMGVNWSFQPGTYRGAQGEYEKEGFYLTYAIADEYKAPWYKDTSPFYAVKEWGVLNSETESGFVHGLAGRYAFDNGLGLQLGWGQAESLSTAYHAKISQHLDVADGLDVAYLFYGTDTRGDYSYYDGLAWQQGFTTRLKTGPYVVRFEGLINQAEGEEGNYLPRLTRGYANSQGSNEFWWDARSDWNEHNEKALYLGVARDLTDWGAPGWNVGLGYAYGWDAMRQVKNGSGHWVEDPQAKRGKESAWTADVGYTVQGGSLKGSRVALHYTDYKNHQDEKGSWYYANMFGSERDIKLSFSVPLNF